MSAAHGHGVGQLGLQLVHVDLHALEAAAVHHVHEGTADEDRVRTQRQRLEQYFLLIFTINSCLKINIFKITGISTHCIQKLIKP